MVFNFTTPKLNGQPITEGYALNSWMASRFNKNKNVMVAVVGQTGSGKSYFCIRALEKWYEFRFNREFPQENICFSIEEAVKRIRHGNLERGEIIIVEEAGVLVNSLDFQNKIAKFFTAILQSFRSKNIGIFFNLPNISFLNKTARTLLHLTCETMSIDVNNNQVLVKPFYWQTNAISGKLYTKYLRIKIGRKTFTIKKVTYNLPSEKLTIPYEQRKDIFVNKVMDSLEDKKEKDKEKNIEYKDESDLLLKAVAHEYNHKTKNQGEIARSLSISQQTVSRYIQLGVKKRLIIPEYLEKAQKILSQALQTPSSI